MADKPIQDLVEATVVSEEDLFVLQQSNTAKKLKGRTLENWLLELAEGHGGINNIQKTGTAGLVDTYTITYADLTTQTFTVTNGREITTINTYYAASSNGTTAPSTWYTTRQTMTPTDRYLWSYQTFIFNGGSPSTYSTPKTVIGVYGEKGDTGEQGVSVTGIVQQSVPSGSRYKDYKFSFSDGTYSTTIRIYDGRGISNIAKTDTDDLVDTYTISYNDNTTSEFQVTNGRSVTSITKTGTVGLVDTYTITYNDETTSTFTVTNGKGITSISKTSTSGLVDTYTISYTDGSTPVTFEVTNGASIQSIAKTSTSGLVDTYTVTLTNGNTTTFTVTNAKSITSVTQTSGTHAAGTTDTYTITFNDGDTTTFSVYNGANGTGSVSTVDGIQPGGNQNVTLLLTGNGAPTQDTVGQLYQRYFDLNSQILYICTNIDTSSTPTTYSWAGTGVPVDSSLSTSSVNPVQNKVITGKVGTVALNTTAQDLSSAVNELDTAIDNLDTVKAPLASPALTGTPTAPTATAGTDTTQIATTAFANKAANNAVSTYVRPNLLDNWYFVGGWSGTYPGNVYGIFPINQRGYGSYASAGYTIDRWTVSSVLQVVLNSNYITLTNTTSSTTNCTQPLPQKYGFWSGKTVTGTMLLSDGSIISGTKTVPTNASSSGTTYVDFKSTGNYPRLLISNANTVSFGVRVAGNTTVNVVACKLELGDTQTLAHNEGTDANPVWVLNEIPNYEEQLIRCQTSQADSADTYANKTAVTIPASNSNVVPIAQGGTGATTAGTARSNLGVNVRSAIFSVAGNSTGTVSMVAGEAGMLVFAGPNSTVRGLVIYYRNAAGSSTYTTSLNTAMTDITLTHSASGLSVQNAYSNSVSILKFYITP